MSTAPLAQAAPPAALPPGGAPCGLLHMAVGSEALAVGIDAVREILEVGRLTALPRMPAFVRGVMNLRGAVVPVIDLAARLGLPPTTIGRRSCVVVVQTGQADTQAPAAHLHSSGIGETGDITSLEERRDEPAGSAPDELACGPMVMGLLVDAVYEVFDAPAAALEAVPPLGTTVEAHFLSGLTRARGAVLGVLALAQVLAPQQLSRLIAEHHPAPNGLRP